MASIFEVLFHAMATEEGWYVTGKPATRCQRNNNPLNLQFCHQDYAVLESATDVTPRFAAWPERGNGVAAAYRQIAAWIERGLTLRQVIELQAPPNENNTTAYLNMVLAYCKNFNKDFDADSPLYTYA